MNQIFSWGVVAFCSVVMAGCAGNGGAAKLDHASTMLQLDNDQWVDLGDAKAIVFVRDISGGSSDPFHISVWHQGAADNQSYFGFKDEASANAAWKRLTLRLGGTLNATPIVAVTPPKTDAAKSPDESADTLNHLSGLQTSLNSLAKCRDEKLITADEYVKGSDYCIHAADPQGNNNIFNNSKFDKYEGMRNDLLQLNQLKKSGLLTEQQLATIRSGILIRFGLASDAQ